jgi:hypothetical protein
MAISVIQAGFASSILGGFDIPQIAYNEVNSATFKAGAILSPNGTAGELIEATPASPTTSIFGMAVQAGQNNAAAPAYPNYGGTYPSGSSAAGAAAPGTAEAVFPLLVVPALPKIVFEMTLANAGNDAAILANYVFTKFGLSKDATSGYWYVDVSKTTTSGSVIVIGIKNVQDIVLGTTIGARVFVCFNATETVFI